MYPNFFKTLALAAAFGAVVSQPAMASTINFDAVASGAVANTDANAQAAGITFDNAVYAEITDIYGIGTGQFHWVADSTAPAVTVADGSALLNHYAPSHGLDAVWQPVMIHLNGLFNVNSFSLTASSFDGSSFFGSYDQTVKFLDGNGFQVGSALNFNAAVSNIFAVSSISPFLGVTDVVLAGGALYDNISLSVTAVPVPGAVWLFGSALAGLIGLRRRKA